MDQTRDINALLQQLKDEGRIDMKDISDGHHTFDELYYHRMVLFSVILKAYPGCGWKSWKHHDGTMHDGCFIVGVETPLGQYTYHYKADHWDCFDVPERNYAPTYDGHTPSDIDRLYSLGDIAFTRKDELS